MSLLWNDEIWFFDKLNKRINNASFQIVRKLFISNIPIEFATLDILSRKFRKYGEIESAEIYRDKYFVKFDKCQYEFYAYVTFKQSESAHKALKDKSHERQRLPFKVQPADTWQQPSIETPSDGIDYLTQMPNECLFEIFDYLKLNDLVELAETCEKFHEILHQRVFSKINKFEFNFNRLEKVSSMSPVPLAKMRKYLLAVGKYLKEVTLIFHFDQDELPRNFSRLIDVFTHFMRQNDKLEVLNLHGLRFTPRIHLQFQQIFNNLITLRYYGYTHNIDGFFYDSYDVDFASYCKNLKTLKITQYILFTHNAEHWNKLENITIGFPDFILSGNSEKFFQNNPGLKRLKLDGYRINFYLEDIIRFLPDLEKLTIFDILTDIDPYEVRLLPQLKKLKKIHLQELNSRNINPLIDVFAGMSTLECVKLSVEDDGEPVMNLTSLRRLVTQLLNLKEFSLKHYKVTEDIVIDLIDCSSSLEICCFLNCEVPLNLRFLRRIIEARQKHGTSRTSRLKLIMDPISDSKVIELLEREDVARLLDVIC